MRILFSIILLFSVLTSFGQINKDQLDELPVETKFYLFMDLYHAQIDSSINDVFMDSLVSNTSNKNIADFFPFIIEDIIIPNTDKIDFSLAVSNEKAFRKQIVDNTNSNQIKTLKTHFVKYISNMANQSNEVQMSSMMYKEGKVYVVIAVLSTILLGIVLYLVSLQKKISKLEKL